MKTKATVAKTVNRVKFTNNTWLFSRLVRSLLDFSLLQTLEWVYSLNVIIKKSTYRLIKQFQGTKGFYQIIISSGV